jgi:hypothetical protein
VIGVAQVASCFASQSFGTTMAAAFAAFAGPGVLVCAVVPDSEKNNVAPAHRQTVESDLIRFMQSPLFVR